MRKEFYKKLGRLKIFFYPDQSRYFRFLHTHKLKYANFYEYYIWIRIRDYIFSITYQSKIKNHENSTAN